ncbi:MAG: CRISPR-associated CARF protein Csa3 [Desulfurococcaceae archaeon]
MSQTYDALVLTLGFEPGPLVMATASHNLRLGASIIVFTSSFKDDRVERAYLEFKKICNMIYKDAAISLEKIEVDLTDFLKAVRQVKEILSKFTDKRIALCFSGGMRALCFAVFIAYLTLDWKHKPVIEVHLEGRAERLAIPALNEVIKINVSEEKMSVLQLLSKHGSLSAGNIAVLMHKDRSTIYRHLTSLIKSGLVRQRGKMYELTDLGLMLV